MMLSFEQFVVLVARDFDRQLNCLTPRARLVQDLSMDSLDLLRLMILCEALSPGFDVPDDVDADELTVGSVYEALTTQTRD